MPMRHRVCVVLIRRVVRQLMVYINPPEFRAIVAQVERLGLFHLYTVLDAFDGPTTGLVACAQIFLVDLAELEAESGQVRLEDSL
jgi:hypothetical protein